MFCRVSLESIRLSSLPTFLYRPISTAPAKLPVSRRAMLYVPGSNPRMLEKSLSSPADSVAYDLEDSVSPGKKADARRLVAELLDGERRPKGEVVARINAIGTGYENDDLDHVLRTRHVQAIALPKTNSPEHIEYVISRINALAPPHKRSGQPEAIKIIAMIENAQAMVAIEAIAASGNGHLDALLSDCADVGLTRTLSRQELLYPRSRLVTTAKAFGLQAIDLVCVNYKDKEVLREESEEGRRLGFDGKQAIHPEQIDIIHSSFAPSEKDILKAARVKFSFEHYDQLGKGAYTLDGVMIDAPVYKQATKVLAKAEAAGLEIAKVTLSDI
ncbi:citrate lyase subunit beta-like protein [Cryptococcus deuterogattii 99/473]|uniref:Citrate lyase subunit beta-like protein n=1 Tax=Cryptococcus deuterogattii Ram5 TaxID=1296110 RepID=A0A0D0TAE7_9TREE|nr:citrate lyase subunit beta-like protein [Cryptococcus deuterogattii LA55]KIR43017.1 citrate lyase subunit beta-like protein [Cryptococcus deuterogattii Ram5]KIR95399.1 citrate lyase subunit beta-like protein [Cryptococcus deuterogattii CBS 10090]KIY56353.1 citrate lyase subunit beta-like protein [Cryptococcus deuterogattii 99/473]